MVNPRNLSLLIIFSATYLVSASSVLQQSHSTKPLAAVKNESGANKAVMKFFVNDDDQKYTRFYRALIPPPPPPSPSAMPKAMPCKASMAFGFGDVAEEPCSADPEGNMINA